MELVQSHSPGHVRRYTARFIRKTIVIYYSYGYNVQGQQKTDKSGFPRTLAITRSREFFVH